MSVSRAVEWGVLHQPWINQGPTPEDRYIQAQVAADEAHQGLSA